jgi:hypothetical protein
MQWDAKLRRFSSYEFDFSKVLEAAATIQVSHGTATSTADFESQRFSATAQTATFWLTTNFDESLFWLTTTSS